MNNLLEVKLRFNNERNKAKPGTRNLRKGNTTDIDKIDRLINSLKNVVSYYDHQNQVIDGLLIDVYYNDIIAKSNRIKELLRPVGKKTDDAVVGARFSDEPEGQEKHIITYYVTRQTVADTIDNLESGKKFLIEKLSGSATTHNFNETNQKEKTDIDYSGFKKKHIRNIIVDCSVINSFAVPNVTLHEQKETVLLTFFDTGYNLREIFDKIGLDSWSINFTAYGKNTIVIPWSIYQQLELKIPYMFSMISSDLSILDPKSILDDNRKDNIQIPSPMHEPVIGVIDTFFDERVYFSEWVENHDYLFDNEPPIQINDARDHGTQVDSIIVDGPNLNPWLEDHCGRFRVRHFGVCSNQISVSLLVRKLKEIIIQNPDIHVWNLCLGTGEEVSKNFISYDASVLDEIQAEHNVIFVISGTNDNREVHDGYLRVASPADSLNSVVVNSVKRNNQPASYSRKGNVLSFFNKPDVSYYGGDFEENERIYVCTENNKIIGVSGTSFAAPWISRKLCYLIDVLGLPKEVAKALLIDSAAEWTYQKSGWKNKDLLGYGIVPIDIHDVLQSQNDEIRFFLYGTSQSYKTSNYAIPIPKDTDNKYPYIARASLCYFPHCSRQQGVDYTSRELSLKFGRVKKDGTIEDINENVQDDPQAYTDERKSRREFRKWENTKFISRVLKKNKSLTSYEDRLWGFSVTSKERLETSVKKDLNFGAVITLKEINGINRIQDFIAACNVRGYIINEIDINNRIDVYNTNQEEIIFED